MRDAGTDPGAVHYHFKGRQALAEAVLDRVLVPLNDRRLELLDGLLDQGPADLHGLVEALVRPDIEVAHSLEERGPGRARLIGAIYLSPADFVTARVEDRFRPVAMAFLPHMTEAAPAVPPDVLAWRVRWCVFGTLGALLADPEELLARPTDDLVTKLVDSLTAALGAPTHERSSQ